MTTTTTTTAPTRAQLDALSDALRELVGTVGTLWRSDPFAVLLTRSPEFLDETLSKIEALTERIVGELRAALDVGEPARLAALERSLRARLAEIEAQRARLTERAAVPGRQRPERADERARRAERLEARTRLYDRAESAVAELSRWEGQHGAP